MEWIHTASSTSSSASLLLSGLLSYSKGGNGMADEQLDKLGNYYVYFQVASRYNITFEQFCRKVRDGVWEAYLA